MFTLSKNIPIEKQIRDLTSYMFHKYYCENDVEAVIEHMDSDIIWLGTAEQEYATGFETVSKIFKQFAGQVIKCNISDEEYTVVKIAPQAYLCSGRIWIDTDAPTQIGLRVHQRITMVFREYDENIKCCHIHISNPYGDMTEDDVGFPIKMAKQSYDYIQEQIEWQEKQIFEQIAALKKLSYEDSLTGLYNRNKFNEILDIKQYGNFLGVACFDLNGLKEINDKFGHSAGDELICLTAVQLKKFFNGKVYRTGGDEFVVVDNEMCKEEFDIAIELTRKMMQENGISCSIGACWRTSNCNIKEQFDRADELMYIEKRKYYTSKQNNQDNFYECF